jgi:hypothetical protein
MREVYESQIDIQIFKRFACICNVEVLEGLLFEFVVPNLVVTMPGRGQMYLIKLFWVKYLNKNSNLQ